MISIDSLKEYINKLLNDIYYSEIDNFYKAKEVLQDVINKDGNIYFFGQGHSVWVGRDVLKSYQLPIKVMEEISTNPKELYDYYKIKKEDGFVIISNSGINETIVELAIYLKEKGHKIIVINSNSHTLKCKSRHPSKKKLYQFGDVVIDNCCVYGDAAIKDGDNCIGSFSSIANNVIVHTILKMIIED